MISQQWRSRLTYAAMSLFVAWHGVGTMIAPAPDVSEFIRAVRVPLQPYLSLFRLDNRWGFFAPDVSRGTRFRYIIEDVAGNHHPFNPTENLNWIHPSFFWVWYWFDAIVANPDMYADSAGAYLCRKHASLRPVSVIMFALEPGEFTPEDQLAGKHPTDSEFVTITTVKRVSCEGPQQPSA